MIVLSIRQPWAWAILHAGKNIENRTWSTRYRGPVAIHTGKKFDLDGWLWMNSGSCLLQAPLPEKNKFQKGGILGTVRLVDCITESESPWFFGPFGFLMEDPNPIPLVPYHGRLGFFNIPDDLLQNH